MTKIGLLCSIGQTIDSFFVEIMNHWTSQGHAVFPAAGEAGLTPVDLIDGLTRQPRPRNFKAISFGLRRWALDRNLDVIITNTATASAVARAACLPCPVIYFCHGLHWTKDSGPNSIPWRIIERALTPRTAGVVTLNSEDADWFESVSPSTPHKRLKYGVGLDLHAFPRSEPPIVSPSRMLWIGEFTKRKNPFHLLDIATHLREMGSDICFDMLGDGPLLKEVQRSAIQRGLASRVKFHGRVEVSDCLVNCHGVVHTSSWEGLSRALLEAVAVGRPVFGYDVKGVRDIPQSETVSFGRTDLLAERIVNAFACESRIQRLQSVIDPDLLSEQQAAAELIRFIQFVTEG